MGVVAVGLELSVEVLEEARGSGSSVEARPCRPSSFLRGCFSVGRLGRPHWAELVRSGVAIFDLDYDAILSAMYALSASAEGDCYLSVPPDPGIEAAALGASESSLPGTAPAEALHTLTLDSGASRCFFRDSTTLTPLPAPVPVRLADPSGGPVVARSSTVLPCPAVPSRSLSGLHLPSFSTNLVSTAALQDLMVTNTTPGGHRVSICTCTRTRRHLATLTCRLGSSLYTLATEPPQVVVSGQVPASGKVPPPCSCCLLSHQTLLWHHHLGHPSLPRLRGMHSRLLVSGLPRSLPPLPPSPASPCLPCVEGRQRAAPHSSLFPLTTAPLQTLHMDVWGPARVTGQGRERYFLQVVDDYMRYTMVFPLRSKGEVPDVLIPWIRAVRLQLGDWFGQDLPVPRLHSDRGGEFSDLLRDFCRGEGITQSFTLPASPQQNGIAERRIGFVMELNLLPRISLLETLLTPRWTGKVGDALVFRVWGSRAFVHDTSADKLFARAIPCVFLGFPPDTLGWQFYNPTLRRVISSQDVTFDESVPFYRLFPYHSAPPPPPPLFLAPGPPPVDPLPPQGPTPSGVSQVDPLPGTVAVEVAGDSGAARGSATGGAASGGAELGGAKSEGAGSGGAEPGGAEPGGSEPEGVEPGGAESEGAESGGAEPRGAALSGDTGYTGVGGAGLTAGDGGTGVTAAVGPRGARPRGTRAAGTGGAGDAGAGDPTEPGAAGAGGTGAGGTGAGGAGAGGARARSTSTGAAGAGGAGARGTGAGGAGAGGARAGGTGTGGAGTRGAGAVDPGAGGAGAGGAGGTGAGGTVRPRPYFVPLLQQVLGVPSSTGLTPPLLCPPPDQLQPPLQPASLLPAPSPYTEQSGGLTAHREPASRPVSPVHTARRVPRSRPPPMALRPSSVPLRVILLPPPESPLPAVPDPKSDLVRAASPTVSRLLSTVVTDLSFELVDFTALVAELVDFAAACRLDYSSALVAESESSSPPSVGGECALGTDVLEDRQEDFECLAAAIPRFTSMLLAPEGDPDAPDIPTPRSYAEAITGPYSSQWQAAMDAEMAAWKSTGTYVNAVPPSHQRQGVDYFQTFSPTLKMTTLRVLLHVATQRDYELHSLDFTTTFLQGSLHEEIWLCRPPGFTWLFSAGTQWSLRRPVYSLRQAPHEWHDTLRMTLAALGFAPSTADPLLFLRTDTFLPPFYVLVYVDDLVFATVDSEALTLVKLELQKRHTCTDLGELRSYLGLQITRDRARRTITLTHTWGMGLVLGGRGPVVLTSHADASWVDDSATQRSSQGYTFSLGSGSVSWRSTRSSSVLRSSCEVEIYARAMAAQELRLLTYLLTDLGEQPRLPPVLYVDNKAMIVLCEEHRLEHRTKHIALRYFLARELQKHGQLRLAYDSSDYTFYHPPLLRFFDSHDVCFDESIPYYVRYPCRGLPVPPAPLFLTSAPPRAPPVQPSPPGPVPSGVSHATPPPSIDPQVQPPLPQSSSQPTADPAGADFRDEDPGGASSRGVGVGAESVPVQGPGSGGAGVGAKPVTAGDSSLRGAGVSGAVPRGATTGGAPSPGPREPGTDPVTSGGASSGGGASGSLESAAVVGVRGERVGAAAAGATTAGGGAEASAGAGAAATAAAAATSSSCLWSLAPRSPLSFSYLPPSLPVSGPLLPPPDPSPAVFPPPLPWLSPPLSHNWPSRRSPRARPSSPVPFTDLRTALYCSSMPRLSPSVLPSPPESALTASLSTPVTNYYHTYRPVLPHVLASLVTDPRASLSSVSALTAAVTEFASSRCLDYATSLVATPPTSPLADGGESALCCDALEDRQFELEFLAAASPHLCAMLLALEGDPDALDIPTPRTYAEAVSGPWASQWRAAMDSEMAFYRSTGTYVDEVPPLGANVVDGMWIFMVKRPPGSPPIFKARYVARGFRHLHEEVWLRHPSAFTGTFPPGTQWRLRRPVYGLRQAPREWHDTLCSTLSDLGFQPSFADPSLFVRRGSTLFFVLVYVDDLVFATADRVALADVKLELQKRHTCTDLGELRHYLGLQITTDRAARTITLSQSHMVQQVLQRFELQHSIVQRTPLAVNHRLTGPFPDEPFEPSGPYAELVGCLMPTRSSSVSTSTAEAEIYAGAMATQELRWLTLLLTGLSEWPSSALTLFTDIKATILLCREPRLESRVKHINVRYFLLRELHRRGRAHFDFVESEANTADIFTKALPPCDHQRCCVQLGLVGTGSRLA
ncbi:unnamed protein product [Closterium sp. NIES-54]